MKPPSPVGVVGVSGTLPLSYPKVSVETSGLVIGKNTLKPTKPTEMAAHKSETRRPYPVQHIGLADTLSANGHAMRCLRLHCHYQPAKLPTIRERNGSVMDQVKQDDMPTDSRGRERRRRDIPGHWHAGILSELDQRTALARELHERLDALMDDLGGRDHLSYQQRVLCERAIFLELWCQREEAKLCRGGDMVAVAQWTQASNALAGLLGKLGLERQAKHIPTLHEYLKSRADTAEDGAA